jgi:MraZ protein
VEDKSPTKGLAKGLLFFSIISRNLPKQRRMYVVESGAKWGDVPASGVSRVFMGEYEHALDSKGRLFIPAKLREDLGERFIITRGLDRCLFVYPLSEWSNLEQKLKDLPLSKSDARAFVRFFFSGATECELDKQGRVLVPSYLRTYAGVERETAILGVSNRVEIWNLTTWQEYSGQVRDNFNELAEKMVDFGI